MQHLLAVSDLSSAEIERIFSITKDLKSKSLSGLREPLLPGRTMALVFEKQSLRTRVSFEVAMAHLGGASLFLGQDAGFGSRESVEDFGRVLSEYVDVIVFRGKSHDTVQKLAAVANCSVINGLTDYSHPCQALADLYTLRELLGNVQGKTLAWVGDANNVARSVAVACGKLGMRLAIATPKGYQFADDFLARLTRDVPKLQLAMTNDPAEAVRGAAAVYTDVWTSMGQEAEAEKRRRDFAGYRVDAAMMAKAGKDAYFLHCLPARRGEEVTDEVLDGPQSVVVQQAANRMHVQKGVLAWLLGAKG